LADSSDEQIAIVERHSTDVYQDLAIEQSGFRGFNELKDGGGLPCQFIASHGVSPCKNLMLATDFIEQ
jgi:hypothetical protein